MGDDHLESVVFPAGFKYRKKKSFSLPSKYIEVNTATLALSLSPQIMAEKTEKTEVAEKPYSVKSDQQYQVEDIPEFEEPTPEDWKNLREVADNVPASAYLVILVEFCERFTYYGLSGPFQNYIQYPDPGSCKYCLSV